MFVIFESKYILASNLILILPEIIRQTPPQKVCRSKLVYKTIYIHLYIIL